MKRFLILIACALTLAGCGTTTGTMLTAGAAAAAGILTPSTPSPDYGAYLTHCTAEVAAQRAAAEADNKALQAGLQSGNEKTQFGSMILLAVKSGAGSPRIGCSVARKKDMSELLLGESNLLNLGVELYRENRAGARFNRQLEADKTLARERMAHERGMTDRQTDLLTTLTGDKLQLQNSTQDNDYRRAQLPAAAAAAD